MKYTKATVSFGISHLIDHDYKTVYLEAPRVSQARGYKSLTICILRHANGA